MIGYRFPNGAVCLAMAPSRVAGEHIILTHWGQGNEGEWVVAHLATHHFPAPEEWYWGHYFSEGNLPDAVQRFVELAALDSSEVRVLVKTVEVAKRRTDAVVMQGVGC